MKLASKAIGVSALLLAMTGSALAQNPGMMSPPFYRALPQSGQYTTSVAANQAQANHRQADRAQVSHSMVQTAQRHQNT
jgi:hypothetical protein